MGIEKIKTVQKKEEINEISITDTKGDVIGTGVRGTGYFIGKEISYTVNGNIINLNISEGHIYNHFNNYLYYLIFFALSINI